MRGAMRLEQRGAAAAAATAATAASAAAVAAAHQAKLSRGLARGGGNNGGAVAEDEGASVASAPMSSRAGEALEELERAAEKAFAAGMGDWHLQPRRDSAPRFRERMLLGPLGPEALKARHGLSEEDCLRLYALLRRHCLGFQEDARSLVAQATAAAAAAAAAGGVVVVGGGGGSERLLATLWRGFAQLWDDATRVAFSSEVAAALAELEATHAALAEAHEELGAALDENEELRERCSDAVAANLERMLKWRALQARADSLEGEIFVLFRPLGSFWAAS